MKRNLIDDIQRMQFYNTFLFVILASGLTMVLIWNHAIRVNKERLTSISIQIADLIEQHKDLFNNPQLNPIRMQSALSPHLKTIIDARSEELTIGFYSKPLDRVITVYSKISSINITGRTLPRDDPGRKVWNSKRPGYSLFYSKLRHDWLLKCDYPIIVNRVLIGHSFANITMTGLVKTYLQAFIGILLVLILLGYILFISTNRIKRKISRNLERLIINESQPELHFDYIEFQEVAALNQSVLNTLKITKGYLQDANQKIYDILEGINDSFFVLDSEWRITYINRKAIGLLPYLYLKQYGRILGFKREELIGQNILEIFPELNGTFLYDQFQKTLNEQVPIIFEDWFEDNDRWFENRIYPSKEGILVFCSDITERKQAEQKLAAEQELLGTILTSIEEGVIATDLTGKVIMMSRRAEQLTGYTFQGAYGKPLGKCFYIINDQTSEPYPNLTAETLTKGKPIKIENAILVNDKLVEVQVSLYCTPLINPMNHQQIGAVIVFEDITQKNLIQEKLQKTEKHESLMIMASGIAHDFNNYLAAILSNIQLAKMLSTTSKSIDKYLDQAIDVSVKASELTRQLLTFSHGGSLIKKLGSIGQLIEETVRFNLRGSKIKSVFSIPDNLWHAEFDPGQISQVITNLTVNAKQAMPLGGVFKVKAYNVILEDPLLYKPGKYLKIIFEDQGMGIPEEIIDKVFDPFFTTKPDGSGLGLAMSYSIMLKHDGYIELTSVPGKGCKFSLYLPASEQILETDDSTSASQPVSVVQGRILLMDDEEMIRDVMAESLGYLGYEVTTSKDGEETITCYNQALTEGVHFDIVILDLTVPGGMGGLDTIKQLLKINPFIKAIISSGYANDPVITEYRKLGFAAFVSKPYKLDELSIVLQDLIKNKFSDAEVS